MTPCVGVRQRPGVPGLTLLTCFPGFIEGVHPAPFPGETVISRSGSEAAEKIGDATLPPPERGGHKVPPGSTPHQLRVSQPKEIARVAAISSGA